MRPRTLHRGRLQRTHDYAVALAEAVDPALAADEQLRYRFLLHDVGKVGVPESVLSKPGPLDAQEWEVIRCHHERWDGKAIPFEGLPGDRRRRRLPVRPGGGRRLHAGPVDSLAQARP